MKLILVIEDEFDSCKLISDVLKSQGYQVLSAVDGATGIQLALDYLPDLIISDINMPEVDGYKVLAVLRQNPATTFIPFIFLSALGDAQDVRSGMGLGADDYLVKPFYMNDLLTAVRVRLEKQEQIAQKTEARMDELRRNITYALPHELRTPLGIVLGYSHLLMDDVDPGHAKMISSIIHSANRLHKMTEKFWTYVETEIIAASVQSKRGLQENRIEHAAPIIEWTAYELAQHFERQADLVMSLTDARLRISEQHLKQIVDEIVNNAFKFSEPATPVEVTSSIQNEAYIITIANEGRGMTAEEIAHIGAYMQFGRELHEQKGVGLGLVISRRLAELYDGSLDVESIPNVKTVVTIRLHLAN